MVSFKWKTSLLTPLAKEEKVDSLADLMLISFLPWDSKKMEKVVTKQLQDH